MDDFLGSISSETSKICLLIDLHLSLVLNQSIYQSRCYINNFLFQYFSETNLFKLSFIADGDEVAKVNGIVTFLFKLADIKTEEC
jgi:hypothetical protein